MRRHSFLELMQAKAKAGRNLEGQNYVARTADEWHHLKQSFISLEQKSSSQRHV